jgi:Secretion system C-terminal sorting domain
VYASASISATFTPTNPNSRYYLRFQRVNTGSFDTAIAGKIAVTKAYPNDEPCGATEIPIDSSKGLHTTTGSNIGAADWKPYVVVGPTCGTNNDVWYKFVANVCSVDLFIQNLNPEIYEMQAAVLKNDNKNCSSTLGKFSEVTACGGKSNQHLDISLTANKLTIGETYYIVIDGYAPPYDSAIGNFSIQAFASLIQDCPLVSSVEDCLTNPVNCSAENIGLSFYPNPVTDGLIVRLNTEQEGTFVLYDTFGKKVVSSALRGVETTINVQDLTKGLYIASVEIKGKRFLKKIMLFP